MFSTIGEGVRWLSLFAIALGIASVSTFTAGDLMRGTQGQVPAIVNGVILGVRRADGSITQKPPFCGPNAHVENVPGYGEMCVQAGKWGNANQTHIAPCSTQNKSDAEESLPLNSCQPGIGWIAKE